MKILVPVDGSRASDRAVRHVIALKTAGLAIDPVLLNVQPEWAPRRSRHEKRIGALRHAEAAEKSKRSAIALLDQAHLPFKSYTRIGPTADAILKIARQKRCDQIVMGRRGLGTLGGLLLGSVSTKVAQLADVPVTLVK